MSKSELIACFQDTLDIANNGRLREKTIQAQKSNKVYKEGLNANAPNRNEQSSIIVEAGTTFATAKKYCMLGKMAVLNFANPENPGGGVQIGAMAQEECLCRSSNLWSCLSDSNVFKDYYLYHRKLKNPFYSDRLIYTKNVTVFKDDSIEPQIMPEYDWFDVDVITCAAPYLAKRKYTNLTALMLLFKNRIKNIFEAARDNNVDVLILGAFGCGAFKNPPLIVAEAFRQVICEQEYFEYFKQIVFAIKPTGKHCENLSAFMELFDGCALEGMGRCCMLREEPERRFHRIPKFLNNTNIADNQDFYNWQAKNRYFGKQFSILGDSISTLEGYNPKGYKIFYGGDNCKRSGVNEMADTWWEKVIAFFGGELLVNNSWSGSRVTKLPDKDILFPSACSNERTTSLHINSIMPDVIIVYLGTNDWAFGAKTGNDTCFMDEDDNELFVFAYDNMLKKLKSSYPHSEIWCCTLSETCITKRPDFTFPHKHAGIHIEEYNEIIRNVSCRNKCKLIDLYGYKMPYDSIDGSHPNNEGMSTIATVVIRAMMGAEVDRFMDCPNNQHEFFVAEQYTSGTKYVCKKCGKIKHESIYDMFHVELNEAENNMISQTEKYESDPEYVLLDPNITTFLYSDTIRLTIESSGKTIQLQKVEFDAGRDPSCDLIFASKVVARKQATFFFERNMWFLRDNNSTNGTWINGTRMQPGKKYQLAANDVIDFAHAEKIIFEKAAKTMEQIGDPEAKAIIFLETGMSVFAKSEHNDELVGKFISERYKVLKCIGQGGTFKVYLVVDARTNRQWALKAFDKKSSHYKPAMYDAIMQEPYMMMRLDHPAIPRGVDIIEEDRYIFIVREYIEGVTLDSLVSNIGAQPADKVIEWGKQLCGVLGYLHSRKPAHIHRDIKPANIILMPDGRVKLIDFGIMRFYDPEKTCDTCCLGTRGYAAPEQFGGRQTDPRTDIYGLGMTMHHLVTGVDPKQPSYETKPICQVNPNLPKGLEYIISKCIQLNPDDRYQSCDELLADLNNYLNLPKPKSILGKLFKKKQ